MVADNTYAIDLSNVAKTYRGKVQALRGIQIQVRRGEIFGLLGPNGAGKSTLVKIMMTIIRATTGGGIILGRPLGHKPTLARVGYLPENHRFPRYLTGRQTIEFFAALSDVDRRTRRARASQLLETVGMTADADRKISTYSKGMLQRVGLAQALGADPDLVLLDEPTDGVDPVGRRDIRNVLKGLREQGKTVFVNSHLLSELEMVCDRVAILVQGTVARQGTMDELTSVRQRFYEIELEGSETELSPRVAKALPGALTQSIVQPAIMPVAPVAPGFAIGPPPPPLPPARIEKGKLSTGQWIELEGPILRVGTTEAAEVQAVIDALRAGGLIIRRMQQMRPSLEDLFIQTLAAQAASPGMIPTAAVRGVRS